MVKPIYKIKGSWVEIKAVFGFANHENDNESSPIKLKKPFINPNEGLNRKYHIIASEATDRMLGKKKIALRNRQPQGWRFKTRAINKPKGTWRKIAEIIQ